MVAAPITPGPHVKALVGEFGKSDGAGHVGIVAPSGDRDDPVLAVALAVWGAQVFALS